MDISPELVRGASASWLEESLRSKLGHCRRCMAVSGALLVATWAIVVALASMHEPIPALLVGAAALGVPVTILAMAHIVAFVLRQVERLAAEGMPSGRDEAAGGSVGRSRLGGCGCGGKHATDSSVTGGE
jgi:hypothetical protein